MTRFDFSPLFRSTIGFDRMTPFLETAYRMAEASDNYPPYNIVKHDEDSYRITIAAAGFDDDDFDIELANGTLTVTGKKSEQEGAPTYLHRGIAAREFKRQFQLAEYVEVLGAHTENGLLHIDLERRVPEALKPRTIEISSGTTSKKAGKAKLIEGESKAA